LPRIKKLALFIKEPKKKEKKKKKRIFKLIPMVGRATLFPP